MIKQRWSNPAHTMGIAIAVPYRTAFMPLPTMTPLEIARGKGAEAKSLGRSANTNPYRLVPNEGQLSAEWIKGYNGG